MQQLQYQQKFCEARELITDNELQCLVDKYHNRHPTFSIDIQERTCTTIILACTYHYRHIKVNLKCQSIYDDTLHKFQSNWSIDNVEYGKVFEHILLLLNSSSNSLSLDDQVELIIEQITKYFTQLKPMQEDERQQQSSIITRKDSVSLSSPIEIIKYERSPQSRRRQFTERSLPLVTTIKNTFNS